MRLIARHVVLPLAAASLVACTASTPTMEGTQLNVELGASAAELVQIRGEPSRVHDRTEGDRTFRTYYYADGTAYVIDLQRDIVCEQGTGETEGFCYPCDYGPGAGGCP